MGSPPGQQQREEDALAAAGQQGATPAGPRGGEWPSGGAPAAAAAEPEGEPPSKRPRLEGQPSAEQEPLGEQLQLMAFPSPGQAPPAVDPSWLHTEGSFRVEACHPPSTAFVTLRLGGHEWKGALICPPSAFLESARPVSAPLKKPRTPFNFFSDAVRPSIKEQHPQADQKGVSKLVGEQWAQLPTEEREPYNEQARQDRERYERELREFQSRFPQGARRDLQRRAGPSTARQEASQQAEAPPPSDRTRLPSPRDAPAAASPWVAAGAGGDASGFGHGSGLPPMPAPPPPGQLTAWLSSIAREGSAGAGGSRDTSGGQPSASGGTFPSPTAAAMLPPVQMVQAQLPPPMMQAAAQGVPPGSQSAALQALQAMLQAGGQAGQPQQPPAAVAPLQPMALSQLLGRVLGGEQAPPAAPPAPAAAPPAPAGAQATADLVSLLVRLAQQPGGQQQPPPQQQRPGGQ